MLIKKLSTFSKNFWNLEISIHKIFRYIFYIWNFKAFYNFILPVVNAPVHPEEDAVESPNVASGITTL